MINLFAADWNGVRNLLGNNHQEAIRDCLSLDYSTKQDFYVKSTLFYQSKIILQSNRDLFSLLLLALRPEYVTNIGMFNSFTLSYEIQKWRIDVGKDMLYL